MCAALFGVKTGDTLSVLVEMALSKSSRGRIALLIAVYALIMLLRGKTRHIKHSIHIMGGYSSSFTPISEAYKTSFLYLQSVHYAWKIQKVHQHLVWAVDT